MSHLESLAEFIRHDVVKQRIYRRRDEIEHAADVSDDFVDLRVVRILHVYRNQALGVEGGPADEEGDHDCDWNNAIRQLLK